MFDHLAESIALLFFAANAGRLLGYIPQIITAWKCQNGASSVSLVTWGYFAFAHFTGILYGLIVIHDQRMALVFFGNFLVCCVLIAIVTWKKVSHLRRNHSSKEAQRKHAAAGSPPRRTGDDPLGLAERCR
jgi:uncharacterized protein with PQ loop repeat